MRTILTVILFLALLAAPARGATVTATSTYVDGYKGSGDWDTVVTVTAAPGEANDLRIASIKQLTTVHDAGAPLVVGNGCHADGDGVACDVKDQYSLGRLRVHSGDRDDRVTLDGGMGDLYGEDGNDVLTGAGLLDGGPGDDTLTGDAPATYRGGPGNDVMTGTGASDQVLDYADHAAGVTVTLGATVGNGSTGENDVISGMGQVIGGPGDDTLTGDDAVNLLVGGAGADRLDGRGGPDQLYGGSPTDTDAAADVVLGGDGPDVLVTGPGGIADGGPGDDRITATGAATVTGGPGADAVETVLTGATVRLDDGDPDTLLCHTHPLARVDLDPRDSTFGCVGRWLHRTGGPAPVTYALTRRHWVPHVLAPALRLACPEDASGGVCPVRVTLTLGRAVAGRAARLVRVDDHDALLRIPLSRAVTRELLRGHHLAAALTVSTRDGAGRVHSTRRSLCLTRLGPHAGACPNDA